MWGTDGNNGVKSENVNFVDGKVEITIDSLNRVGGAIESKEFYNSGSFEFVASTNATSGVAMAFWTFYYEDAYYENNIANGHINHEIDIELFGKNNAWFTSYIAESVSTHKESTLNYNLYDNETHTYRFDWISGEKVDFYIDGLKVATITENVPTKAMKVWIGAWCPSWAGDPVDEIFTMTVERFSYTAF